MDPSNHDGGLRRHLQHYGRRAARLFRGTARLLGAWGAADAEEWIERWRRLTPPAGHWWRKSVFDRARAERTERLRFRRWLTDPAATVRIWAGTRQPPPGQRARWNRYAETDAARYRLLVRLDPYQKRAVACFEDRTMVTAGAGSGKTRTMVAHAGYAIKRLGAQPETIAFITFTGKAAREIHHRTGRMGLKGLTIGTIHKLARGVLKRVDGVTVQPDRIARDEKARRERVAGWLEEEIEGDPNLAADAALRGAARTTDPGEGEASGGEYRLPPHGPTVRSYGEVVIGTLLQAASVEFRYEANFPMPDDMDDKEYHPDFYIPDNPDAPVTTDGGIWLEHYAHDRHGNAPAEFEGYDEQRAWKRRLHRRLGTRYLETSFGTMQRAWDGDGPSMAHVLARRLRAAGREVGDPETWTPPLPEDIRDRWTGSPGPLALEVDAWIRAMRQRPKNFTPKGRDVGTLTLRRIASRVMRRYEDELKKTNTLDDDGVILAATEAARRRPDRLPWRHVIVDEYQDVNPAQAAFLHALTTPRSTEPGGEGATLIGVGDDWQAIFGFQGGDSTLIRSRTDPSGTVRTLCEPIGLLNTYRFGQRLADATRAVATSERGTRDREVQGLGPEPKADMPAITVAGCIPTPAFKAEIGEARTPATVALLAAFKHWIPEPEGENGNKVLVMGRRNMDIEKPDPETETGLDLARLAAAARDLHLKVEYRTIHKAKGSEADYAILIDSGTPRAATRPENVALRQAISAETGHEQDDEHRLWYVALTRARRASLIIVSDPDYGPATPTRKILTSPDDRLAGATEALERWLVVPDDGRHASWGG